MRHKPPRVALKLQTHSAACVHKTSVQHLSFVHRVQLSYPLLSSHFFPAHRCDFRLRVCVALHVHCDLRSSPQGAWFTRERQRAAQHTLVLAAPPRAELSSDTSPSDCDWPRSHASCVRLSAAVHAPRLRASCVVPLAPGVKDYGPRALRTGAARPPKSAESLQGYATLAATAVLVPVVRQDVPCHAAAATDAAPPRAHAAVDA